MRNRLLNTYQPFEVSWFKQGEIFYVLVNKGYVHSFFKPERKIDVAALVDITQDDSSEIYELSDGQVLYLEVYLTRETIGRVFTFGIPVGAAIGIGDALPELEEPPFTMYFEICRANGSIVEQGICSDVWAGWKRFQDDSSSSGSQSSSSHDSSNNYSSSSSSSSGGGSGTPYDSSSSYTSSQGSV